MNAGQQGAFSANSPGLQSRPNAYALGPHPQDIRGETPCRPAKGKLSAHRPSKLGSFENT